MQGYMALALFSGLFAGLTVADDLHWINAVLAMALYCIASVLATKRMKGE